MMTAFTICLLENRNIDLTNISKASKKAKMSYETGKQILHPAPSGEKAFRIYIRTMSYAFIGSGICLFFAMIWA